MNNYDNNKQARVKKSLIYVGNFFSLYFLESKKEEQVQEDDYLITLDVIPH